LTTDAPTPAGDASLEPPPSVESTVADGTEPAASVAPTPPLPADLDGRVRRIAFALLAAWAAITVVYTGARLVSTEEGWRISRGAGAEGVTGVPLRGAPRVTAVRSLLATAARGNEPWLVLVEADVPAVQQEYLRGQLMVQEFPRQVTVAALGAPVHLNEYAGVVLPAAVRATDRVPVATAGGYSAYRVAKP
jgi:hypothetical protein